MPNARLLASGLLHLDRDGELRVLDQLTSLIRRNVRPAADLYDQLLGKSVPEALPWEAFAHLGREAEVAAAVLRAALASQESGINILLYGPPGTGKTSFAATLAAHVGVRLRPVAETDDGATNPVRHERLAGLQLGPAPRGAWQDAAAVRRGGGPVRRPHHIGTASRWRVRGSSSTACSNAWRCR